MRVFVINMDEDTQRLEQVARRLRELNVAFERVPAVDGRKLSDNEIAKKVASFKWHCIVGQPPTRGEIGCTLSHVRVYEKMRDEDIPVACVLEDDVILDEKFSEQLMRVQSFCEKNDDSVVLLSDKAGTRCSEWRVVPLSCETGAFGYVITRNASISFIRQNTPVKVPSDFWKWLCRGHNTRIYKASPVVCDYQRTYASHTIIGKISIEEMSVVQRLRYWILRFLGLLVAHLFF